MARNDRYRLAALAYYRTSSATNIGPEKDSERRQRDAVSSYARHSGHKIIREFNDPAVSGTDSIEGRPGFAQLLEYIAATDVRVVIVEDASRFARHLMTQEAGIALLMRLGVRVLTANGDDLTESDDEFRVAMRQILGVFAQLEKTRLVKKLKAARDVKKQKTGKCGGRRSHAEMNAKVVEEAKRLRRRNPVTHERMSFAKIGAELERMGHLNANGRRYAAESIRSMVHD